MNLELVKLAENIFDLTSLAFEGTKCQLICNSSYICNANVHFAGFCAKKKSSTSIREKPKAAAAAYWPRAPASDLQVKWLSICIALGIYQKYSDFFGTWRQVRQHRYWCDLKENKPETFLIIFKCFVNWKEHDKTPTFFSKYFLRMTDVRVHKELQKRTIDGIGRAYTSKTSNTWKSSIKDIWKK